LRRSLGGGKEGHGMGWVGKAWTIDAWMRLDLMRMGWGGERCAAWAWARARRMAAPQRAAGIVVAQSGRCGGERRVGEEG